MLCAVLAGVVFLSVPALAADAARVEAVDAAIAKAQAWLQAHQNKDGSYGEKPDVGITGLVITAFARSPKPVLEKDGSQVARAVEYLVNCARKDGAIVEADGQLANYKTSIGIMALTSVDRTKYAPVIERARAFVAGLQFDEKKGFTKEKSQEYGGIGYGSHEYPDMSNTKYAIESLKDAGMDEKSETFRRAVTFLQRCQNLSSTNDETKVPGMEKVVVGTDGGGVYRPTESKAGKADQAEGRYELRSYGSMTYALLLSFIYCGVDKDDARTKAAYNWIRQHYTLDDNPGMATAAEPKLGKQGLYYYYHTLAKALSVYGERTIQTPDGKKHDWAVELAEKLIAVQKADGSWVNEESRWMEASPTLVTSYAVLSLSICRAELAKR
jgi:squalene-hopene/tetraprenyl-beta-curcumene cyclase